MNVLEVAIRKIILDGSILILFFRVALDLVAWTIKNLLAKQESQVWFLGWEDSLEKGMATHSSIAWESHGKRSLAGYSPWCHKESDMTERLSTHNYKRYQNHISFYCAPDSGKVGGYFEAYWETEFIKVDLQWWLATNLEIRIPIGRMD